MTYFSQFPLTTYELSGKESVVVDIFRRSRFISEYIPLTDLYDKYTILDGETPQMLALRFYDSAFYHWVILMFNEIHNPYFDWPLDTLSLEKICSDKYGDTTMYMTKHYIKDGAIIGEIKQFNPSVTWIPPVDPGLATAVSFYDYEQQMNDSKRDILILKPTLLGEFVKQFNDSINNG